MSDEKKAVRIEMEFDDGTVQRLTGEQAQKWLDAANGQAVMGWAHGMEFPQFDWEVARFTNEAETETEETEA